MAEKRGQNTGEHAAHGGTPKEDALMLLNRSCGVEITSVSGLTIDATEEKTPERKMADVARAFPDLVPQIEQLRRDAQVASQWSASMSISKRALNRPSLAL